MRHLLLSILVLSTPAAGFAADPKTGADQAGTVAKTFLNGYVKASMSRSWDSEKWVASRESSSNAFMDDSGEEIESGCSRQRNYLSQD